MFFLVEIFSLIQANVILNFHIVLGKSFILKKRSYKSQYIFLICKIIALKMIGLMDKYYLFLFYFQNKTGIIDVDGRHCFVMPLNRSQVLPPRDLIDLVRKMWDGLYFIVY